MRTQTIQLTLSKSRKTVRFTRLPKRLTRSDLSNLVIVLAVAERQMSLKLDKP